MAGLVQTTAPAYEPISLVQAKQWLRIDSADEDVLLTALIEAARTYVETFTGRALITQQWELSLDAFPGNDRLYDLHPSYPPPNADRYYLRHRLPDDSDTIRLPRAPLASVESVKYYDPTGALQTLATSSYFADTRAQPGRVVRADGIDWPDTQVRPNAVVVAYTCGYGTPNQVPSALRIALRFILSNWFENRLHVVQPQLMQIPDSAEALLWQYRLPSAT